MVDTVHIYMPPEHLNHIDPLAEYPQVLKNWEAPTKADGCRYIRGSLRSLKVSASDTGIRIKGSLPKFLYNQNVSVLTRHELYIAIEEISSLLGVNVHKGIVARLHFGATLKTCCEPLTYFRCLERARYYTHRNIFQTTLYYSNGRRQIAIYDKVKEARKKRILIPKSYQGSNLLRIECKLESSPGEYLQKEPLHVADLWSKSVFNMMVEYWLNSYMKIKKVSDLNFDTACIKQPDDVTDYLAILGIEALGGVEKAKEMVDELKSRNALKRREYYSRVKRKIDNLAKRATGNQPNGLIVELNEKVESFAQKALIKSHIP